MCCCFKEAEIYWPDGNESLTFGHITVTHRGVEVKGDNITITLGIERFKKVIFILHKTSLFVFRKLSVLMSAQ